jgi:hypothetical protein
VPEGSVERPGRGAYVLSQLYYYVAAVIGFGLVLGGLIGALKGARTAILPREFETIREAVREILRSLSFALPGAAVLWWHLREARRRESTDRVATFWGKSLYYHLVALVALGFALGGAVLVLTETVDATLPTCFEPFAVPAFEEVAPEFAPRECESRAEGLRGILDGVIFLAVSGPLFLWHLREGRKATRVAPPEGDKPAS